MTRSRRLVLLALAAVAARRAGDPRPAGAPPARGRPRLPGAGQARSRRSTTSTSSSRASRAPTPWASALLEIGRYRMEVEGDPTKARAAFEQVTKQHARSDAAPGAYYYLGLLTLDRATTPAEIEDALAQFARVETLYPRSAWVPRALAAQALAPPARRPLRRGRATSTGACRSSTRPPTRRPRRPVRDRPRARARGPAAPRDGGVPAGPQPLPEERLGRARAASARPRSTGCSAARKPSFALDPSFSAGGRRRAEGRAGARWWRRAARSGSPRRRRRARCRSTPRASPAPSSQRGGPARALALARGRARDGLAHRGARRAEGHPDLHDARREAGRAAEAGRQDPRRGHHAGRRRARLRRGARGDPPLRRARASTRAPSPAGATRPSARSSRILLDGEGGIVTLDRDEKTVRVWRRRRARCCAASARPASSARSTSRSTPSATSTWPTRSRACSSSTRRASSLATIASPELRKAAALTLDATGAVLVYDDRAERVLRYR